MSRALGLFRTWGPATALAAALLLAPGLGREQSALDALPLSADSSDDPFVLDLGPISGEQSLGRLHLASASGTYEVESQRGPAGDVPILAALRPGGIEFSGPSLWRGPFSDAHARIVLKDPSGSAGSFLGVESARQVRPRFIVSAQSSGATGERAGARAGDCKDINTADSATLQTIVGIGPAKERAMLEYIERIGAFHSIDEMTTVSGVSPSTLANIRRAGFCAQ